MLNRIVKKSGGNESGGVGHIDHKDCTDFVGETAYAGIIPFAAVSAGAGYDEFRTFGAGFLLHLLIIDAACLLVDCIANRFEHQSGEVHRTSVAQMASVAQVHAHKLVAGLQARHEDCHISLCSAMRLNVCPFGTKKFLGSFDC